MISSHPLGEDEPPKKGDSESSSQRDGPPRSHALPYDRSDRVDRYDRPRPLRRDSRAGPDLRERDWRRPLRPPNHTSSHLHSLNRRDDRSARDRMARERKRAERPRDRADRVERPERPDRSDRSDKLDRRSSWQHTSAPYVRENGHHASNSGGHHGGPARHVDDDDYRTSRTGRPEPRFTRRPGDSFWDLMTGQRQRQENPLESSGHAGDLEDKRFKQTARPSLNGRRENENSPQYHPPRHRSSENDYDAEKGSMKEQSSVSKDQLERRPSGEAPRSLHKDIARDASKEERRPLWRPSRETLKEESVESGGPTRRPLEQLPKELAVGSGKDAALELSNERPIESVSAPKMEPSAKSPVYLAGPETSPSPREKLSEANDDAKVSSESHEVAEGTASPLPSHSKQEHAVAITLKPEDSPEPLSPRTEHDENRGQPRADVAKATVGAEEEASSAIDKGVASNIVDESRASEDVSVDQGGLSPSMKDAGEASSRDIPDERHGTDESASSSTKKEMDPENGAATGSDTKHNDEVETFAAETVRELDPKDPSGEAQINAAVEPIMLAADTEMTDAEVPDVKMGSAVTARHATQQQPIEDVEMPDVPASGELETKVSKSEVLDTWFNDDVKPNMFSVESITDPPPRAVQEPLEPVAVKTPQETRLHNFLTSQYASLSAQVKPEETVLSRKWSLSAPDPRVSISVMAQQAELQEDIRARQRQFSERKQEWLLFCKQLDDEAEARAKPTQPEVSKKNESHTSNHARRRSKDFEPEVHRRNRERSRAHGDVARSEAEFLEILANLEAETARDPLVRARQTSARIPPQRQYPTPLRFRSTNALVIDHNELTKRLKVDAVDDFTPEEHERFIEAYVKFPKEFGLIAEQVGREFNECVMHYYRTKKDADYKRILQRRRKSKRGRKPKKKEQDGELPVTPVMDSPAQFSSPGTPKTPFTPGTADATDAVATATSTTHALIEPMSESEDPAVKQAVADQHTEVTLEPTPSEIVPEPIVESTPQNEPMLFQQERVLDGHHDQSGLNPRIPPPVLPLADQPHHGKNEDWTPSAVLKAEQLFAVYGSKLDEIAQQMGRSADSVRTFYEQNQHKYLSVIQKADSANARSNVASGGVNAGPNAGFFPPRNINVPVASAIPLEQEHRARGARSIQQVSTPQSVGPVVIPATEQGIPPVVQPPNMQHEPPPPPPPPRQKQTQRLQAQTQAEAKAHAAKTQQVQPTQTPQDEQQQQQQQQHFESHEPLEPRILDSRSNLPGQSASPMSQQVLLPQFQVSGDSEKVLTLPSVKALSFPTMPILPCLPNPVKLADPLEFWHLDRPFQQYRESNERRQ